MAFLLGATFMGVGTSYLDYWLFFGVCVVWLVSDVVVL